MAAPMKKAKSTGHRYTDAEKKKILAFIKKWNQEKTYGGVSQAMKKFGISYTAIAHWTDNKPGANTDKRRDAGIRRTKAMAKKLLALVEKL